MIWDFGDALGVGVRVRIRLRPGVVDQVLGSLAPQVELTLGFRV